MEDMRIERIQRPEDMSSCAAMMAGSEPWITLGRGYEDSLKLIKSTEREVFIARIDGQCVGCLIICMIGAFRGYIQTIVVAEQWRNRGIGSRLLAFAEEYVFKREPNLFICVSSFNKKAKELYLRQGFEVVGELHNYIVQGYSEILMRKTMGPLAEFRRVDP
jgi:ribosomal protein S18 acetylase RimI-like enzyme